LNFYFIKVFLIFLFIRCNWIPITFDCDILVLRHGVYKNNLQQINPHASKKECKKLLENDLIYGCACPLQIIKDNEEYKLIICDYI